MSSGPHWKSAECVYCGETAYRYGKNGMGVQVYKCEKGCQRRFTEDTLRQMQQKTITPRTALPRSYEWRPLTPKPAWRPIR